MRPAVRSSFLASLLALATAADAQSIGSLNRTGAGARAAGMANAFVAVSDDGTAASWNPAGLAQLRRTELSFVHGSFVRDFAREGFRSPDGAWVYSSASSDYTGAAPEFASLAVPVKLFAKPVTFQVDWRRQYQFGGRFEADLVRHPTREPGQDLRLAVDEQGEGQIDQWSLASAVQVSRHTSIGVSASLWQGAWAFSTAFAESPLPATAPSRFLLGRQRQTLSGANATLGVLFDHGQFRLGAVVKTGFRAAFGEQAEVVSSERPTVQEALTDLDARVPASVAVGAALRPGGAWTVALDLTWDPWSRFAVEGMPGSGDVDFFSGLPLAEIGTRDTISVNLGAEKLLVREGGAIPLRAGIAWEPQGPRDVITLDPQDYRIVALGSGFNTNRIKLDVAVQYAWTSYQATAQIGADPRPTTRAYNAIGRVASHEWRLKFAVICRLAETDALLAKLKKLF